jgi:hypothetical protein
LRRVAARHLLFGGKRAYNPGSTIREGSRFGTGWKVINDKMNAQISFIVRAPPFFIFVLEPKIPGYLLLSLLKHIF